MIMFYSKPGIHTLEGVATRFLSPHSQLGPDNLTKESEEGIFCHNRNKSNKKKGERMKTHLLILFAALVFAALLPTGTQRLHQPLSLSTPHK